MSWTQVLYDTYENNVRKYGDEDEKKTLVPISHMNANAQLELTIDGDGEFIDAKSIGKDEAVTLIPVTEKSASRSSGAVPHPLCDTLSYIAGDFGKYCVDYNETNAKKKKEQEKLKNKSKEKNDLYIENLERWVKSKYTNDTIVAIYKYLKKGCLIKDLINKKIVTLEENGCLDNKKIAGQPYEKVLVRFRVSGIDTEECIWKNQTTISGYVEYYQNIQENKSDICYITGKTTAITQSHPKGIVAANYSAKLMSANDNSGYTYRGRFSESEQACTIGYETSQKIHAALTWLAANQGIMIGTKEKRTFICWNSKGKKVPDIFSFYDMKIEDEGSLDEGYRRKLTKALQGYLEKFDDSDEIIFISLDAATTGRLSITYYNEQSAWDFMEHVKYWSDTLRWYFMYWNEKKKPFFTDEMETPSLWKLVNCAFGTEREKKLVTDDKILKEQTQRLVKCLIEKQPLPFDIVSALKNRASTPEKYSHSNRERILSVACSAIIKYKIDHHQLEKEEGKNMVLDLNNHNRSYLFGRLLAVLEKVERATYTDERREPNAIRLQSAYVNHPMQTWQTLDQILNPYFQKLRSRSREYYRRLISDITIAFLDEDQAVMNQPLKEDYLLGYYLQRAELNGKAEKQTETEE